MLGIVIASGIFKTPSTIASNIPTLGGILLLWLFGGFLTLFGAFSYAELSTSIPKTGGHYVFIREAWGPLAAFIFGWAYLLIGYPCSLAGIGHIFGESANHFLQLPDMGVRALAAGGILLVGIINYLGVRQGSLTQDVFAYGKILAVLLFAALGFLIGRGNTANFQPLFSGSTSGLTLTGLVAAFVAILWTYDGWCDVTAISGEMRNPGRDMARTLVFGMGSVIGLYLVLNVLYVYLMPLNQIATSEMVARDAAKNIFGAAGAALISALIMVATFGGLNGNMIAAPRVFFAMARDGIFIRKVGEIHSRFGTPHWGIVTTIVVSVLYVMTGSFEEIINYFIFVSWIFYMLNVAGVIALRIKKPNLERPYKTWGYPFVPILFVLAGLVMVVNIFIKYPQRSGFGLLLLLLGIPAYFLWRRFVPSKGR